MAREHISHANLSEVDRLPGRVRDILKYLRCEEGYPEVLVLGGPPGDKGAASVVVNP